MGSGSGEAPAATVGVGAKVSCIAIFVPSLRGGGAERVMLTLASGFADCGFTVDLLLAQAVGPYSSEIPETVRLIDLSARRVLTSIPALVHYLRRQKPQVLLTAQSHANVVATFACLLARVSTRLVLTEHNTLSSTANNLHSWKGRWMPWFMKYSYPRADGIVAVSNGVADDLARTIGLNRQRITTIYNPVVTPNLMEQAEARLDHSWFEAGQPPVVLGIGRLTAQKDFHTLLRAFAKLRQFRFARLMILGEGVERSGLEQLARELDVEQDVAMPGFVSNPYKFMKNANMLVMSSRWEGFGNVLAEAMGCGTPVVATNCPSGPAEILEHGRWGRLVQVGDAEALAAAMDATLDDEKHPEIMRRANDFSVEPAVQQYLNILQAVQ
jgi:glycosyltransferase involved in cell wall biosynthesis